MAWVAVQRAAWDALPKSAASSRSWPASVVSGVSGRVKSDLIAPWY
jgi:hypothetical protein